VGIENPVHLLFLGAVALIVLGPKRLPELARAAGKGMREFRESLNGEGIDAESTAGGQVVQRAAEQVQHAARQLQHHAATEQGQPQQAPPQQGQLPAGPSAGGQAAAAGPQGPPPE
jgi:sec-independent protein translocase protein TatA